MTYQPDAFFGCEWGPGGEVIVNTFLAANYYLKALVGGHSCIPAWIHSRSFAYSLQCNILWTSRVICACGCGSHCCGLLK
jgi:hypothetical protein